MGEENNLSIKSEQEKQDIIFDESVCSAEFAAGCTLTVEEQQ